MSHKTLPRRRFLGQVWQACQQWVIWALSSLRLGPPEPGSPSATAMIDRAVKFLRPRQDARGGWLTQREPGITALVVTAVLRSGEVTPADPMVTRALSYLEGFIGAKGGLSERLTRITQPRSPWLPFSKRT